MFETYDFDYLMDEMLSEVSEDFDTREGSVIYDALAPAAAQLAQIYASLDMVLNEAFADTASYYYLIKRAAERNLFPHEETQATCKMAVTPADTPVSIGDRFSLNDFGYEVTGAIDRDAGTYELACETAGTAANQQIGELLPVETENELNDMERAEITEILAPGRDEEDVESFRERYFESFDNEAYGGNKADYVRKVREIDGVGGCKVYRRWNGGFRPAALIPPDAAASWVESLSEEDVGKAAYEWVRSVYAAAKGGLLTTGGTVEVVIVNSEYARPSQGLIDAAQEALDPEQNAGEGDGIAPVGHVVKVSGVSDFLISVDVSGIEYLSGYSFSNMKGIIEGVIDAYFLELRKAWDESEGIIVRARQIESRLLAFANSISDISGILLNGQPENVVLGANEIPVRGDVIG